jgi:predicted TIM-barrel fold metal-dependent hydrolase
VTGLIDTHHHVLPPVFLSTLGDRIGRQTLKGPPPPWSPQISLDLMDRNGIQTAVTSFGPPGFWFGNLDETKKLVRQCNDYCADLRRDHPGRFGMFAVLPMPDVDSTLKEIEYAFDVLKADGVEMMTNIDNVYPGDPKFAAVFAELNRRKATLYFHPISAKYGTPVLDMFPPATLEFPFDTTRAVLSLLYSGTLAGCRDMKFLFSHAGGTVPYLAARLARLTVREDFAKAVPEGALAELRRLYFDTALTTDKIAFASLLQLAEPDHVLFGSDFPQAPESTTISSVRGLKELGLNPAALRGIQCENAAKIMPNLGVITKAT